MPATPGRDGSNYGGEMVETWDIGTIERYKSNYGGGNVIPRKLILTATARVDNIHISAGGSSSGTQPRGLFRSFIRLSRTTCNSSQSEATLLDLHRFFSLLVQNLFLAHLAAADAISRARGIPLSRLSPPRRSDKGLDLLTPRGKASHPGDPRACAFVRSRTTNDQ